MIGRSGDPTENRGQKPSRFGGCRWCWWGSSRRWSKLGLAYFFSHFWNISGPANPRTKQAHKTTNLKQTILLCDSKDAVIYIRGATLNLDRHTPDWKLAILIWRQRQLVNLRGKDDLSLTYAVTLRGTCVLLTEQDFSFLEPQVWKNRILLVTQFHPKKYFSPNINILIFIEEFFEVISVLYVRVWFWQFIFFL